MEDVTGKLHELNEPAPMPLKLPGGELLVEIEGGLLVDIPTEFREFLLLVDNVAYNRLKPVTVTDSHSYTYLPGVAVTIQDPGAPRELIPLYEDGGSYYCVAEDGGVVLWADGDLTDGSWNPVRVRTRDVWLEN